MGLTRKPQAGRGGPPRRKPQRGVATTTPSVATIKAALTTIQAEVNRLLRLLR